ncbi:DUF1330 domain-containing protein [Actinomadura montaniterrae]|uniref:DUF1330 domain-containing protein n=1 Tax=Actinomadura montaniterrae TaxID=1803903 RepID=A0A6L3VW86_9ACTN|nr:DUF1330 domain-containing protein [Actinomadura montaniterrae]KAB2381564.1 DUF1330 domain-containing protein [Actinomadura montaniterrae]
MAKGYWVSVYPAISDPESLTAYNKLARQAVQAGGGRTLSRGARVVAHEAGITQRVVLVEFDSFEQAVATYESEAYQKALVALPDGVERDFRIVEGID